MNTPLVLTETHDAVTTLTLNRPDKRNALDIALLEQLCAGITAAEADPNQRVLVLRGAGPVFCSGLDLAEAARPEHAPASAERVAQALRTLDQTRLITIAAVQGAAIAGGAGLMSVCDFVVATRDAKFGYPEVRRGLVPGLIMTFLRRQLRERDVREVLLLGRLFDAARAQEMGLINRVVDDEPALATEVKAITKSVLQGAPEAVARTKRAINELWPRPVEVDLNDALAIHVEARNSSEAREGIAAFHEKRAPRWQVPLD